MADSKVIRPPVYVVHKPVVELTAVLVRVLPQTVPRSVLKLKKPLVRLAVYAGIPVVRHKRVDGLTDFLNLIPVSVVWHEHSKTDVEADSQRPALGPRRSIHLRPHFAVITIPTPRHGMHAAALKQLEEALHSVAGRLFAHPFGNTIPQL